ncbi:MAG: adventurous gliding motility protein CglE [Alphaproteobacteria bacterium]|nr:adventurous gliding motility protein CglE [Alphaproteobacteria bacterium]
MKLSHLFVILGLSAPLLASSAANAQGYDDLDDDDAGSKKKSVRDRVQSSQVREINRGLYLKASVGGAFYLGNFANDVSPGSATALSVGQDFLDRERTSMAWEFGFAQGIHQGTDYQTQGQQGGPYVQGDLRTYTFAGMVEWNTYPHRRWGVGARVGGGLMLSPLLMDKEYYEKEILTYWGITDPGYHGALHPIVQGGPNVEYYTKLAHFSIGMDIDVSYAIGFDLGACATGNLKYTF